jgi:hypothetical protein
VYIVVCNPQHHLECLCKYVMYGNILPELLSCNELLLSLLDLPADNFSFNAMSEFNHASC